MVDAPTSRRPPLCSPLAQPNILEHAEVLTSDFAPPTDTDTRYVPGDALRPPPAHVNPPPMDPLRKSGGGADLDWACCRIPLPAVEARRARGCSRCESRVTASGRVIVVDPPPDLRYHAIAAPRGAFSPLPHFVRRDCGTQTTIGLPRDGVARRKQDAPRPSRARPA